METDEIVRATSQESYTGLFIRDYIGEEVSEAGTGGWTNSPDIICSGPNPLSDPSSITKIPNYNAGLPALNSQMPGQANFVYVRGKNVSAPQATSTVYLYYARSSLGLLPNGWQTSAIQWNGAPGNAATIQVGSNGDIVDTTPAFLWTPPTAHEHYCLVAWTRNGEDQGTAPTLPTIDSWTALGTFILAQKNVAWRNTQELAADNNVFRQTVPIDNPNKGGTVNVGLEFSNVPANGTWEFTVPMQEGPAFHKSGTVKSLSDQPYAETFPVSLPDDWTTTITFTYTPPTETPIPANASIEPLVILGIGGPSVDAVRTHAPRRLVKPAGGLAALDGSSVQYGMVVGSVRYGLQS